jgi:hypothetical protein
MLLLKEELNALKGLLQPSETSQPPNEQGKSTTRAMPQVSLEETSPAFITRRYKKILIPPIKK